MNLFSFVKQKVPILDVVGDYTALKKMGLYYKGTCPFHHERTASFSVSPHKDIFYCFGCHEGGDVIAFIEKVERCSPLEAAQHLIARYGLEVPEHVTGTKSEGTADERKRYYHIHESVAQWAHEQLYKHPDALKYITDRGITAATIKKFTIGYFPLNGIKSLVTTMHSKGILVQELIAYKLILEGKTGPYSPFEDRILFVIKDNLGRCCGFGGRIFRPADERSKYYNSHDHMYFSKGSVLYGLDQAKKNISEQETVFLTEGYVDVIMMVQYGFENTVATLGTACTAEHLKQLAHYAQKAYVLYDGDAAGQKAITRLVELCWQTNIDLSIITLPQGEDPASFLTQKGNLRALVAQAQDIFTFLITQLGTDFEGKGLQERVHLTKRCIELVKQVSDPLKRELLLQNAAQAFNIPLKALQDEFHKITPSVYREKEEDKKILKPSILSIHPDAHKISQLEKKIFSAILSNADTLSSDDWEFLKTWLPEPLGMYVARIAQACTTDSTITGPHPLLELFSPAEKEVISMIIIEADEQETEPLTELLLTFYRKKWKIVVHNVKLKIDTAQQLGDHELIQKLLIKLETVKKKMLQRGIA